MAYRVVCISRVTAAGCEPIAQLVADRLGFRYVDDEVITLAAERAGLDPAILESAEHHRGLLGRLVDVRRFIEDAILEIARCGQVVIVAHAASMALARHADVLRVHVTASIPTRVHRLSVPNKLLSEGERARAIAESDRKRERYLARFYDIENESPMHYDLVINTDVLGIEQAVAAVVAVATM